MARMYCEECGETIEEECGWSTPQAGICGKCLEHRRGVTEMAKFLSATLDDDWVRITYGTTDRAPVFYLSVAEVDELHALAHGDPDGQSDNIDQMLDQRLNERREKCICPVCGDPETHANDCEIGAAEAEVERLRACLEFYAKTEHYVVDNKTGFSSVTFDGGGKARDFLRDNRVEETTND